MMENAFFGIISIYVPNNPVINIYICRDVLPVHFILFAIKAVNKSCCPKMHGKLVSGHFVLLISLLKVNKQIQHDHLLLVLPSTSQPNMHYTGHQIHRLSPFKWRIWSSCVQAALD